MHFQSQMSDEEFRQLEAETYARQAKARAFVAPAAQPVDWSKVTPTPDTEFQAWRDLPAEWLVRGSEAYRQALASGRA